MKEQHQTTPLMAQYFSIKQEFPDLLLFFQVGDFYELFFDDAKIAAHYLALTLTSRGKHLSENIPLCGVPVHAVFHYVGKLLKGGFKVALCEQVSKPVPGRVVDRRVTRVFTPGTLADELLLDTKIPSYLFSFVLCDGMCGLFFAELLSAQSFGTILKGADYRGLDTELSRFCPTEIIVTNDEQHEPFISFFKTLGYVVSVVAPGIINQQAGVGKDFLHSKKLSSFSTSGDCLFQSIDLLDLYLKRHGQAGVKNIEYCEVYEPTSYLILDQNTQRNLELVSNIIDGTRERSLLSVLDQALTGMGSRLIKKWLLRPLVDKEKINQRYQAIRSFLAHISVTQKIRDALLVIGDLERVVGRIALKRAVPRDYMSLRAFLGLIGAVKKYIRDLQGPQELIDDWQKKLSEHPDLLSFLDRALEKDLLGEHIIKNGFDDELDRLRAFALHGHQQIVAYEQQLILAVGIGSLKVVYTDIFGYAIEITKTHKESVPSEFILQQTLANRNRYVTVELKSLEQSIALAKQQLADVEVLVYERIKDEVFRHISQLREACYVLADVDALYGFAKAAGLHGYVEPVIHEGYDYSIEDGRHPIVEKNCLHAFISNGTKLTESSSL